jgi:hypothetical protein
METPFKMRESYNIVERRRKSARGRANAPRAGLPVLRVTEWLGIEPGVTQVSQIVHHDSYALWHRSAASEKLPAHFVRLEEHL